MINWAKQVLSPQGRIGRRQFWLGHLLVFSVTIAFGVIGGLSAVLLADLFGIDGAKVWAPIAAAMLAVAFAIYAEINIASKRFKDRGYSRVMPMALLLLLGVSNYTVGFGQYLHGGAELSLFGLASSVVLAVAWMWLFVELGFRGSNARTVDLDKDPLVADRVKKATLRPEPAMEPEIDELPPLWHIDQTKVAALEALLRQRREAAATALADRRVDVTV